jgi:hypothetical protein
MANKSSIEKEVHQIQNNYHLPPISHPSQYLLCNFVFLHRMGSFHLGKEVWTDLVKFSSPLIHMGIKQIG